MAVEPSPLMHGPEHFCFYSSAVWPLLCIPMGIVLGGGETGGSRAVSIYPVTWRPFSVCSKEAVAFPVSSAVFGVACYVTSLPAVFQIWGQARVYGRCENFKMWKVIKKNKTNQINLPFQDKNKKLIYRSKIITLNIYF